jgi:hypothetical protein
MDDHVLQPPWTARGATQDLWKKGVAAFARFCHLSGTPPSALEHPSFSDALMTCQSRVRKLSATTLARHGHELGLESQRKLAAALKEARCIIVSFDTTTRHTRRVGAMQVRRQTTRLSCRFARFALMSPAFHAGAPACTFALLPRFITSIATSFTMTTSSRW